VLAEHVYKTTGKTSRIYSADKGSTQTIDPHIKLGLIDHVYIDNTDPFMFLNKAVKGMVRDPKTQKWVPSDLSKIGMIAFEGMRSFAEELLMWLADKSADGINIGGGSNVQFNVAADGEMLKVGGSNQSHYKVVQDRMTKEIWASERLPVPWIAWTSSVSKEDSGISSGKVLGPDVIGRALTEEVVRWFTYVFRIDTIPAKGSDPEKHVLYLGTSVDQAAGNATALGNIRMPLDAATLKSYVVEPADVVKAIELVEKGAEEATDKLRKRLEASKQGLGSPAKF
jgi:hypothetical protein